MRRHPGGRAAGTPRARRGTPLAGMLLLAGLAVAPHAALAEPYLAVRTGLKCAQCHVNPTGGGQRTAFGNAYAQTTLAGRFIGEEDAERWTGEVNRWLAVGGDVRTSARGASLPDAEDPPTEFALDEAVAYLQVSLIPDVLSFNFDEQVAPGGATNRQSYALFRPQGGALHVKAGRFYLPFGLRLEDDGAFIRQVTGVNFATPDTGIEVGFGSGAWSAHIALTNGAGGGAEIDDGKQLMGLAEYAATRWRVGVSASHNDTDLGDRQMAGAFVGLRTGPIAWLAEMDVVRDETLPGPRRDQLVGLLEGNWGFGRGHNLKLTYERFDPDDDTEERTRSSLVWEYFPFQFIHARAGLRLYDGIAGIPAQNRDEWFAQLHVYF